MIAAIADDKLLPAPTKIFVFCNGCSPEWHNFIAIAEDGCCLTGHVCSDHGYAHHDMGVDENGWKRDIYAKLYPNGFVVEYVEIQSKADFDAHPELVAAAEKNRRWSAARDQVIKAHVELHGTQPTDEFIHEAATKLLAGGAS